MRAGASARRDRTDRARLARVCRPIGERPLSAALAPRIRLLAAGTTRVSRPLLAAALGRSRPLSWIGRSRPAGARVRTKLLTRAGRKTDYAVLSLNTAEIVQLRQNEGFKYITAQHVNAKVGTNERRNDASGAMLAARIVRGASGRPSPAGVSPDGGRRARNRGGR